MSNCKEIISEQIGILKLVVTLTNEAGLQDKDLQLAVFDQVNRERRTLSIQKDRNGTGKNGDTPTEKQKKFALSLGIEKPEQYSKAELSKKIEKAKQ